VDRPGIVDDEHPFDTRSVPVVDGVRQVTVDDGPEDAEETLVFLHGNPSWSFLWRRLLAPAVRQGHRVVAPDHVGFGRSEKPLSPPYHSLERHVQNLEVLVDELDLDDVTLVLHDWGGPIGMGLATRHPERVRRIAITNTIAFAPSRDRSLSLWHKALSNPLARLAGERFNLVAETAFRLGVRDPLPDEVCQAYRWPMQERGARVAASRWVEMVPDGPDHPSAETLREIQEGYARLQDVPVLVLWADGDPVMRPTFARKWRETFPEAEVLHVSEDAGHFWQEDDPDAFRGPMLDWLAKTG